MINIAGSLMMKRPEETRLISLPDQQNMDKTMITVSLYKISSLSMLKIARTDKKHGMAFRSELFFSGEKMPDRFYPEESNYIPTAAEWLATIMNRIAIPNGGPPPRNIVARILSFLRLHRCDYIWTGRQFLHILPMRID